MTITEIELAIAEADEAAAEIMARRAELDDLLAAAERAESDRIVREDQEAFDAFEAWWARRAVA